MLVSVEEFLEIIDMLPLAIRIFILSLIPALLTSLGALSIIFGERIGEKGLDIGLGFSAGVMLVASFTSLLLPAISSGYLLIVYIGFVLGVLMIHVLNSILPHTHIVKGYEGPREGFKRYKKMILVVFAIIIHNIPEGMAIGVSIINNTLTGLLVAIAIGLQDIPEGLAVSLPYYSVSRNKARSLALGFFSGFTELLAAYIPLAMVIVFSGLIVHLMPFLMSLSAGAMIYVVVHELVPEIYGHGYDDESTIGFFMGFVAMLLLDTMLG